MCQPPTLMLDREPAALRGCQARMIAHRRHQQAIDCAGRGADCAAGILHREFESGLASLKAIECIAPLVGAFGTAIAIRLPVIPYPKPYLLDTAGETTDAFAFMAISLPVAIIACAGSHYL